MRLLSRWTGVAALLMAVALSGCVSDDGGGGTDGPGDGPGDGATTGPVVDTPCDEIVWNSPYVDITGAPGSGNLRQRLKVHYQVTGLEVQEMGVVAAPDTLDDVCRLKQDVVCAFGESFQREGYSNQFTTYVGFDGTTDYYVYAWVKTPDGTIHMSGDWLRPIRIDHTINERDLFDYCRWEP